VATPAYLDIVCSGSLAIFVAIPLQTHASPSRLIPFSVRKEATAMNSLSVIFAYIAPQPFLPMTSILAVVVGVVLILGRKTIGFVTRWARPTTIRRT
jgi:hypothetical protein